MLRLDKNRPEEANMTRRLVGDHVTWNSEAGHVSGKIIKVHTKEVAYKRYTNHASKEDSRHEKRERQDRPHRDAQRVVVRRSGERSLQRFVWAKHPPYLNLFVAPAKFHEVFDELTLAHSNKKREARFLAFARNDNDCLEQSERSFFFRIFEEVPARKNTLGS
jgi:hypothetical protein